MPEDGRAGRGQEAEDDGGGGEGVAHERLADLDALEPPAAPHDFVDDRRDVGRRGDEEHVAEPDPVCVEDAADEDRVGCMSTSGRWDTRSMWR